MSISAFNKLASHATSSLEKLHALPGNAEIVAKKNFCGTLQLRESANKRLISGAKTGERDYTEYGSTALYSKVLHQAVDDLLRQPKALSVQERTALAKWKVISKSTLKITAIYDLFRLRLPGVFSNWIRGNDPLGSVITKIFGWFYSPSSHEYETVAKRIVQKIQDLKPGDRVLIPYGTNLHETLLCVEKDRKGVLSIKLFDPTRNNYANVSHPEAKNITEAAWWEKVVRSKMSDGNLDDRPFEAQWQPYASGILPVQRRNTCFAHCHWNFLRLFLAENFPSSIVAQRALEGKIKKRIYELSCPGNDQLMMVARLRLEKQRLRHQLVPKAKEVVRLTRSLLKGAKQKNYQWHDREYSLKLMEQNFKSQEKELKNTKNFSKGLFSTALMVGRSNYSVFKKQLESWKRSSSSVKKNFAALLETDNKLSQEFRNGLLHQLKSTVEIIESRKGILAKIYLFIFLRSWGEPSAASFKNTIEHYYGVNKDAFEELFRERSLNLLWTSLSTPQEVLEWSKRILAIAEKFKTRQYYAAYLKNALFYFIEKNQFKANDPEWLKVKPQLLALREIKQPS
jgi:hypothetical protein